MKKILLWALVVGAVLFGVYGEARAKLPQNYSEFKARYQSEGRTMEGAAHLYFEAVFSYLNENTRGEASKMLRYAMYLPMPLEQSNSYKTFVERMKPSEFHYIFRSFSEGTSPETSYAMSPDNFKLKIVSTRKESDFIQLFLRSSGADSPRSIWMQEHDGLWYTINNASTYSQVREPKAATDARRNAHDADYDVLLPKPAKEKTNQEDSNKKDSGQDSGAVWSK
ncbi:MAG: hypothetical protein GX791_04735 [Synergistaceae bacterium]|nr:hypothetical protein [Synergistaceae bacterium]